MRRREGFGKSRELKTTSNLQIVIEEPEVLRDKVLITGFHGLGGIGHLTVRYIAETALKQNAGRRIGYIVSNIMPPFVEVLTDGTFGIPYELIETGDSILLLIRFQPTLEEQALLADELTKIAEREDMRAILLMGGIDISAFPDSDNAPLVYVANEIFKEDFLPTVKSWDLDAAPKGIFVTGGVALFLTYATHRNIPAAALFAPTEKGIINRQEALRLAKKVVSLLNLPVKLDELERELRAAQTVLRKMQEKLMREIEEEKVSEDVSQLFT